MFYPTTDDDNSWLRNMFQRTAIYVDNIQFLRVLCYT